jgi:hypothetical protein
VVLAEDADGNVRYQGETSGITINAGEITQAVVVDTYRFIPTMTAPGDGAQVDPHTFSLEWETVQNADQYLVQVAEDIDFQTMVIDETTPAVYYAPATLAVSTQYFWRVSAVDLHTNIGTASEVRSFTTSDPDACTYTIEPTSQTVAAAECIYDVTVSAVHGGCNWTASADGSSWISLSPANGSGAGTVRVTVQANTGAARAARVTIAGQTHTVNQDPPQPDLMIPTGSPTLNKSSVAAGGTVTLGNWTVRNQGESASGDFSNGFYLSTDAIISTSDTLLDSKTNTGLNSGKEFEWGGPTLTIPASTAPGTYYIGILVDTGNAVTESNKSNNYVSSQITIDEN